MRFASLPSILLGENIVLIRRFFRHGQRLMDRFDEVLIVGLAETTQDLAGFLWTNAAYCSNCRQRRTLGGSVRMDKGSDVWPRGFNAQLPRARAASE